MAASRLVDFLRAERTRLLERWQQRVAEMLGTDDVSRIELLDHMPPSSTRSARSSTNTPGGAAGDVVDDAPPAHGLERLRVGFDVDEVVRGLLTDVIVHARRERDDVVIEVLDGCGGRPEDGWTAMFEQFTQAGSNRTGFGLGLAIAKQAVEAHGGTIGVANRPPTGCMFEVRIPARRPTP